MLLSFGTALLLFSAAQASTQPRFLTETLTGVTSAGEECSCEVPEETGSSNIVISRPECDPNDVETCQANCANLHGVDTYLKDKCCMHLGQSASLLAFEEDSQWVPRIEEFNRCTGASVRLEYLPEGEDGMADALRSDLGDDVFHDQGTAAGQGIFDAYIVQAPWLWPVVNGLENLTPLIRENADTVQFLDINAASRSAVSYNGTVRALPLDTDYVALGWRQDVFHNHNIPEEMSPPRTIQDLADVAQRLNGLDFNNDGEGDWGICLTPQVNYFYAFVAPMMQSALRDPSTGTQTGQNMFFSADSFEPLIRQPAFKAAMELYWTIILNSNCQDQLAKGEKCDRKTAFPTGRCAMVVSMPGTLTKMLLDGAKYAPAPRLNQVTDEVEWDINTEALGEGGSYWGRRAPFPGSSVVQKWDAEAGYPLVECASNESNCPLAEGGINYAPFFAEGGEAYAINGRQAKPSARRLMWDLFTWLSELPVTELPLSGQYRKSHLAEEHRQDLTLRAGWPNQMVDDLFNVLGKYFRSEEEGGNPVQDLLMLGFPEYMGALDEELHDKFLGVAKDSTGGLFDRTDPASSINPKEDETIFEEAFNQFVDSLESRYNSISNSISGGQIGQLQRWRQSLNLPWRTNEELCVAVLASVDEKAFRRLQCPSMVDLEYLCRLQPDDFVRYEEDYCASFSTSSEQPNLAILIPSILVPAVFLVGIAAYVYVERKKRSGNSMWAIKMKELKFDEPHKVIGRGSFGVVLLAEYRGTQVAVKRVIPATDGTNSANASLMSDDDELGSKTVETNKGMSSWLMAGSKSLQLFTKRGRSKNPPSQHKIGKEELVSSNDATLGPGQEQALEEHDDESFVDIEEVALHDEERRTTRPRGESFCSSQSIGSFDSRSSRSGFSMLLKSKMPFGRRYENSGRKSDFIREMSHLSKLRHPCITTVMGAVIEKSVEPMLVMEYCDHGSLYDLIHNESMTLDGDVLLPIFRDICQGIRFLHAATPQIIHRDLKAANILVDGRFRAKVADFGFSARKTRGATGTPFWMAPELLRGESNNTPASDAYSFGIILYEVYSRKHPYEGESLGQVISEVTDKNINKRPPIPQSCPSTVATIMTECVEANPNTRPTFEELDLRLKRLSTDNVTPQDSPFVAYNRKNRESKAETLLRNVFPPHIAIALREGRKVEKEHHKCVTIFFSDIVGFTTISAKIGPEKVADLLDRLYTKLDNLSDKHNIFKIETIGDAYMAITNLVTDQSVDHVKRMAAFSTDAIDACNGTLIDEEDSSQGNVQIRVGFHSGPVLSGVVGTRLPKYGVFGDTVNTASRMESNSKAMRIHCSKASATLLKAQAPEINLKSRGRIRIKGKQEMLTYWVNVTGQEMERAESQNKNLLEEQGHAANTLEAVTLSELARTAKKSGMKLSDFPNTFGARTLAELLSRRVQSTTMLLVEDEEHPDLADFFLQSLETPDDLDQIEKVRHEVAARLGVRVAS